MSDLPCFIHRVPDGWSILPLRLIGQIANGATPSSGEPSYWDGEVVWVTPDDLGKLVERDLTTSGRKLTEAGYLSCGTTLVPANSIILSTRAPIGHLAIARVAACVNQGCRSITLTSDHVPEFFFYQLYAAKADLASLGTGSTFRELSREKLAGLKLLVPPPETQRAIADYLDRETAKIDALIAKQEALIEGAQEHWRATLSGAVSHGLGAFPDAGNEHDWLGAVPNHWNVVRMSRVFRIFSGYAFSSSGFTRDNTEAPVLITPGSFTERGTLRPETDGVRFEGTYSPDFKLSVGDLVIVMTDLSYRKLLLGRAAFVEREDVLLNQRIGKLIFEHPESVDPKFVRFSLNADCVREQIIATARGATVFHSSPDKIRACWMAIPPLSEQREIVRHLERVEEHVESLTSVCRRVVDCLRERRAALITAAVTGQIDVATNIAAEAAA